MLRVVDAVALRAWCRLGRDALAAARDEIDALNVYPVPDGDTGTNLLLTMAAGLEAVEGAGSELPDVARALVRGAVLGARGNSGVLLSQLLQGLCDVLVRGPAGPVELARALERGADLAYASVADPVEGTLLSVARGAADAALTAAGGQQGDLAAVVAAACSGAAEALARTTDQLPALRAAGVVDAGGRGWSALLDALAAVVTGTGTAPGRETGTGTLADQRPPVSAAREPGGGAYAYEVQYLLRDTDADAVARLRTVLAGLGDSLAVAGSDGLYNVHVHVDDVGAAVEAGIDAGRPYRISVERFADAVPAAPPDAAHSRRAVAAGTGGAARAHGRRAVVAVVGGTGAAGLFRAAGAEVVDAGPPGPTAVRLLAAVLATGSRAVVLLPNGDAALAVAAAAARDARGAGVEVEVLPTRSVVQGLAALAVSDGGRDRAEDLAAMTAAAAATRFAEVTPAVQQADTSAGTCLPGDAIGLLDGRVAIVGADLEWVARGLLDRLGEGAELLTLVLGADAPAGLGDRLRAHVAAGASGAEVVVLDGGMPRSLLLLGAE